MLKRLSKPEPGKSEKSSRTTSRKASEHAEPSVAAQTAPLEASLNQALQTYTTPAVQVKVSSPKNRQPPSHEEDISEQIGRHFMAITKEPSHRQRRGQGSRGEASRGQASRGQALKGPSIKRLSVDEAVGNTKGGGRESNDSIDELLPPISPGNVTKHDGNVVTQQLEDTTGIKVRNEISEYLVLKGKQRARINPAPSLQAPVEPHSGEHQPKSSDSAVLRTSLLLEKMEEGEKETRIDGDGKEAILIQTTMSEKETAIVGSQGSAVLLPTSELGAYQEDQDKAMAVPPPPPPSSSPAPPPPPPPPPPEPEPETPVRKPWPGEMITACSPQSAIDTYPAVLVGVNDVPKNREHRAFLMKVSKAMGDIEYSQFRRHWLDYQQCKTDVVQFYKKIKLLFRGSRYVLLQTCVLGSGTFLSPAEVVCEKELGSC